MQSAAAITILPLAVEVTVAVREDQVWYRCQVNHLLVAENCRVNMPAYDRDDERGRGRGGGWYKRSRQLCYEGDEYREMYDDDSGGGR